MASLNKVSLLGRLGKDPEMRYTQSQTPVASFSVATTEYYKPAGQMESQESTEWHRVKVFGRQAENVSKYLSKGSMVYLDGKLRTSSWEDSSGQKKYMTEVVAQNVQFLSSPNRQQGATAGQTSYTSATSTADNGGGFPMPGANAQAQDSYGGFQASSATPKSQEPPLPVIEHDTGEGSESSEESPDLPF